MTPKDALSAAVDAHLARLAGPRNAEQPNQRARSSLEGITAEITANLLRIAEDRAAKSRAEAERQAVLKAAQEYQAAERGRQLLREFDARQAALAEPATPAQWPATTCGGPTIQQRTAPPLSEPAVHRSRQWEHVIFAAAFGREPANEAELDTAFKRARDRAEAAGRPQTVRSGGQPPSLLVPYL